MPAGDLVKVGDRLIVEVPSFHRGHAPDPVEVIVTKAARVWLEMIKEGEEPNRINSWRMRRDTQDSGDRNYSQFNSRFYTPEQYERKQLLFACDKVLRDNGIEFKFGHPHRNDEQFKIDLANWLMGRKSPSE